MAFHPRHILIRNQNGQLPTLFLHIGKDREGFFSAFSRFQNTLRTQTVAKLDAQALEDDRFVIHTEN
jgi:hypothetical protein